MKKILFLLFCLFHFVVLSQEPFNVYLVGDAGEDTVSGKALLMLQDQLMNDSASAVVFMGDNVYPSGFNGNNRITVLHLESQLNILKGYKGQAYFLPGNHDWDAQGKKGLKKIRRQSVYVDQFLKTQTLVKNRNEKGFLPANGLPGPESVMLNKGLRLITIDTQWFLHAYKKNKNISTNHTIELFFQQLDSLLKYADLHNEQVIVTAHHPMYTNGEHARKLQPWRFLINYTPFKLLGLGGIDRVLSQDLAQPRYKRMRKKILAEFAGHKNIIYASGHDHNVQCFRINGMRYIISGNGSKLSSLRKKKSFDSVFQDDSKTGFIKLTFIGNTVTTSIYRVGEQVMVLDEY